MEFKFINPDKVLYSSIANLLFFHYGHCYPSFPGYLPSLTLTRLASVKYYE